MKTTILSCCLVFVSLCGSALAGGCDYFTPWSYCGWGGYSQTTYSQESVPYYALHPPVYYSRPIARTYGDNPFPYPPGMTAFQAYSPQYTPQPQIIRNEYNEEANPSMDQQYQTHMPLRIHNPFVEQGDSTFMSKGARQEVYKSPKPLVIYPTSLARHTK